jgi:endonuclease YncB( thermonuclease family)
MNVVTDLRKIILLMTCLFLLSLPVTSATSTDPQNIRAYLDGQLIKFDTPPAQIQGSTLVPMLEIFTALDLTTRYDAKSKKVTATKENLTLSYTIGAKTANVNGKSVALTVPGQIIKTTPFVPLRLISAALGTSIGWDQETKVVTLSTAEKFSATVVDVVDGDTVKLKWKSSKSSSGASKTESVRLIGVDTPETVHPTKGVEPYGKEASNYTKSILKEGTSVWIEFDEQQRDRYGRLLVYLFLTDGTFFNAQLVSAGYAKTATFPPNVRWVDVFTHMQTNARENQRGLWGLDGEKGQTTEQSAEQATELPKAQTAMSNGDIVITSVDKVKEIVIISNRGKTDLELKGWKLVSVNGNQVYMFPTYTLKSGATIQITSGPNATKGASSLMWTKSNMWNNTKADPAKLYDASGALVSEFN